MKRAIVIGVVVAAVTATVLWPQSVLSHETLTTTVLYDREIVRILDKHCVMCHVENGPAFPLSTYEQTWLQGRQIRAGVIARHMPPWPAVQGYGQFANDNSLTLRETQFIVGWVEGLGPRNAGTVFTNIADAGAAARSMPMSMPMPGHTGHWHLGEPDLMLALPSSTIDAGQADQVKRTIVDPQLKTPRAIRGVEYMPGDRRVVRAAFFTVQETGQWIGSWTPWYGYTQVPAGSAYRLPAGAHIVAEIHYRGAKEQVVDRGMLGLLFADQAAMRSVSDLVLEPKGGKAAGDSKAAASGVAEKLACRDSDRGGHLRVGPAAPRSPAA